MDFEYCMVYITTSNEEDARNIGKKVVDLRLAACANVVNEVSSIFHWKNKIEEDSESMLILKTRIDLYEDLEKEIKKLHSYEVPCIVAYPIIAGNKDYLDWIDKSTRSNL